MVGLSGRPSGWLFSTDKVRALLVYLAMHAGRRCERDLLATLFWPDSADDVARRNLRQTLHRLKQNLARFCRTPTPA
ncbi:MAG: winged helix-turn-helix domain-containing protein [Caldilineaceae bacterium]